MCGLIKSHSFSFLWFTHHLKLAAWLDLPEQTWQFTAVDESDLGGKWREEAALWKCLNSLSANLSFTLPSYSWTRRAQKLCEAVKIHCQIHMLWLSNSIIQLRLLYSVPWSDGLHMSNFFSFLQLCFLKTHLGSSSREKWWNGAEDVFVFTAENSSRDQAHP